MKKFGMIEFRQNGYTIPNSDPSRLVIDETEIADPYQREPLKVARLTLDGTVILEVGKRGWSPHLVSINREFAIEKGIITQLEQTSYTAVLDGLYYLFNPLKHVKRNGQIYANTITKFKARLKQNGFRYSVPTIKMRDAVEQHLKEKFMRELNAEENSQVVFAAMQEFLDRNGIYNLKCCYLTGKLLYPDQTLRHHFDEYRSVDANVNPIDYNYIWHEDPGIWLRPNENIVRGYVYDTTTDHVCDCPTCGQQTPHSIVSSLGECRQCANNTYQIHGYSTRAPQLLSFKAKNVRPDTLYLGVELEYETTDRDVARMKVGKALKGHAIMKSDGSIRHGFEVVTCPATLDIQLDVFKVFYENKPKEITNGPNVGMHVHVSRKPLSMLTVGKLTEFMNRPENKKFITYVAGRELNTYCNQSGRTITFPITNERSERYNTLNLSNKDTIEFRIFSTPLTYEDFASKVQFCQALVDYAKPCNLGAALKEQTFYQNFINWVMPQRKSYPELVSKLKEFA